MSKSPNELLITIRQYLSTIFGNDVLVLKLTNNPNFANIVAKGIAIHNNLEIICKTDEKITQKYVDNFKSRTGKDVNLNEFASITNLDDILDEVNYLNVAVKNLFDQKSLSEFSININNNVNLNIENNLENKNATSNSSNSTNAFCIVFGFTFVCSANSLTDGNRSPNFIFPDIIYIFNCSTN